jgi:hypothetical protein
LQAAACDPCGLWAAAPGSPSTVGGAAALVAAAGVPGPFGFAELTSGWAGLHDKRSWAWAGVRLGLTTFDATDLRL